MQNISVIPCDRELVIALCHGATACVSGYRARSPRNWDLQQNAVTSYWFGWECLEEEEGSRQNRHGDQIMNALISHCMEPLKTWSKRIQSITGTRVTGGRRCHKPSIGRSQKRTFASTYTLLLIYYTSSLYLPGKHQLEARQSPKLWQSKLSINNL